MGLGHSTTALAALLLSLLCAGAMLLTRNTLGGEKLMTIIGGFAGANVFHFMLIVSLSFTDLQNVHFLLQAVSNAEMEMFGEGFQAQILPEGLFQFLFTTHCSVYSNWMSSICNGH